MAHNSRNIIFQMREEYSYNKKTDTIRIGAHPFILSFSCKDGFSIGGFFKEMPNMTVIVYDFETAGLVKIIPGKCFSRCHKVFF